MKKIAKTGKFKMLTSLNKKFINEAFELIRNYYSTSNRRKELEQDLEK